MRPLSRWQSCNSVEHCAPGPTVTECRVGQKNVPHPQSPRLPPCTTLSSQICFLFLPPVAYLIVRLETSSSKAQIYIVWGTSSSRKAEHKGPAAPYQRCRGHTGLHSPFSKHLCVPDTELALWGERWPHSPL